MEHKESPLNGNMMSTPTLNTRSPNEHYLNQSQPQPQSQQHQSQPQPQSRPSSRNSNSSRPSQTTNSSIRRTRQGMSKIGRSSSSSQHQQRNNNNSHNGGDGDGDGEMIDRFIEQLSSYNAGGSSPVPSQLSQSPGGDMNGNVNFSSTYSNIKKEFNNVLPTMQLKQMQFIQDKMAQHQPGAGAGGGKKSNETFGDLYHVLSIAFLLMEEEVSLNLL